MKGEGFRCFSLLRQAGHGVNRTTSPSRGRAITMLVDLRSGEDDVMVALRTATIQDGSDHANADR